MDPLGGGDEGSVECQVNLWPYTAAPSPGIFFAWADELLRATSDARSISNQRGL
jgi:hypothetical protein